MSETPPAAADEPILRVENLRCAYGERVILEDVSFEVRRGEVVVILGGSGSGKSTLLKNVIGLQQPAAGRVFIEGVDFHATSGDERRRLLERFGVTYQQNALFGSMTLLENVRLPLEEFTDLPQEARDLVASLKLRLVGLAGFDGYLPAEISGGMRKRAAIARALALDPPLLFLDEPSAGLDPISAVELDQLILSLVRALGTTFVIVSHELQSIYTIADRVVMLNRRRVVAEGAPERLRDESADPWVRAFFRREVPTEPAAARP
jgi:phospholipid/cholesterol/gamma-HCH transport system ATP-binding protein